MENDEITNDEITNDEITNDEITNDEITTIVFPACGQNSLYVLGALKSLHEKKYWHNENIKEIFATSSGSILGMIVLLNIDLS